VSDIPFDCEWREDHIDVFQTDGKNRYDHGIYDLIQPNICGLCGNPNIIAKNRECNEKYLHRKLLNNVDRTYQIGYHYKPAVREFMKKNDLLTGHIWKLKKNWHAIYAKPLGKAMFLLIKHRAPDLLDADMIVPVPNHVDDEDRDVKAVALANELGDQFKQNGKKARVIPALRKIINISTRGMSRDRKEEVVDQGMFEYDNKTSISNQKIILVDDVLTNGIIKGKCASLLRENGANTIWGVVAGRNFSIPIYDY